MIAQVRGCSPPERALLYPKNDFLSSRNLQKPQKTINQSTSATKIRMIFCVFSHSTNRPLGFLSLQSIKIVQFYQRVCSRPALLAFSPLFI
jgi:hypothetical protein